MLGEHEKSSNHEPKASDLQAFDFVLPTSQVGYYAGKPIESVVYSLNNLRAVTIAGWSEAPSQS